jgi:transcriptional regulator with XRE-family HTH domain
MRFDGHHLKELRIAKKWDQHRLAEAARSHGVGITQSQISRYENGKEPSGRNALALATALGVTVEELFADDEAEAASMNAAAPLTPAEFEMFADLLSRIVRPKTSVRALERVA